MNTAEQTTVTGAQLEQWARDWYAAQAPQHVTTPWPPAWRDAAWVQVQIARWRCRAALPVSATGRAAVVVLAVALAWVLLALAGTGPA